MPKYIKVWSFEERLTNTDKEDLLRHFGASTIQHIPRHGKDKAVIASFDREEDCEYAMKKLHQQEILGKRLMVVYKDSEVIPDLNQPYMKGKETKTETPHCEDIIKKLKEYEIHLSAIASSLDVRYPIPPYLKYLYPPPSANIIANIAQMLVTVPKFYTQVLHLMNKMNLPPPFTSHENMQSQYAEILRVLGVLPQKDQENIDTNDIQNIEQKEINDLSNEVDLERIECDVSETESELESDHDGLPEKLKPVLPAKRKLKPNRIHAKRPNLSLLKQTFIPCPRPSGSSVSEVFESSESIQSKKLELKLTGSLPTATEVESDIEHVHGGFGKIEVSIENKEKISDDPVEWKKDMIKYISKEELQSNKINKADWAILPVFKNYQQGEPSSKLYIKNLAKNTTEADLKHIYGRYIFWHNEEEVELFTIRLMKEGRMKGQAFVTFPSSESASEALKDTNGYILNDKPMVVAFGKTKPPFTASLVLPYPAKQRREISAFYYKCKRSHFSPSGSIKSMISFYMQEIELCYTHSTHAQFLV
ncbi:RNA-binding region-containing protein 3 [Halocaridina rubra]|uniref:RNA-binding region-containing protein 3 n=1 Tax=Halocaridina rubra TaxID=373956 RepID=A0AAN8WV01_HALRR